MNTKKKASFTKILSYVADYRALFIQGLVAMILVVGAQLAGPLILQEIIDKAIPMRDESAIGTWAIVYVAMVVGMGALTYFEVLVISKLGLRIVTRIKTELFSHLMTLPVSYFDVHPVGELMARVESDTEKVKEFFSRTGLTLISSLLFLVGMIIILFTKDSTTTLYLIVPLPFILAGVFFMFDKLRILYDRIRKLYAEVCAVLTEFIQGIEILQVFNRTKHAIDRLFQASLHKRDNEIKASLIEYGAMGGLGFMLGPLLMALIIKLLAPGILQGNMTLGVLLVFLSYAQRLFDPLMSIAENIRGIQQARVAVARITSIMELAPEPAGSGILPDFSHSIEFRSVNFAYKSDEPVLRDVSFTIRHGETIALVGASGSGKTTTVSLLCRFYAPTSGEILVDGVRLDSLDLTSWRRKIGLVLQDVFLFPGSVLENVRVYDDTLGEDAVFEALSTVHARDFVERLPNGIASQLLERGSNLSMGEKQLLSFARAVTFKPEIVVMDEATASVDVATEKLIQESMRELQKGRTSLIVAHRLSSVLSADKILFFKDGRIVAQGTHDELLSSLSEYAELVRLQFPDLASRITCLDSEAIPCPESES